MRYKMHRFDGDGFLATDFLASVLNRMNGFLYRCANDANYTMMHMTDGVSRLYGHPVDSILGNKLVSFADLIHKDEARMVEDAVNIGLANRENWNVEYRFMSADGSYSWVHECGGGVWDANDTLLYAEGAVFDIADLRRRVENRQQFLVAAAAQTETMIESLSYLKLLSINAGILAARAGEPGAGFGVLAKEMRNLAEKTEHAVRELKQKSV
jgi:hypothetical protein